MDRNEEIALRPTFSFQDTGLGPQERGFHSVLVPVSRAAGASTHVWATSRSRGLGDISVPPQPPPVSIQFLRIHRDVSRSPAAPDLGPAPAQQPQAFLSVRHFRAALAEENRALREERRCKGCREREINAVLVPCGHMYCLDCARTMSQQQGGSGQSSRCPVCGTGISSIQQVYY